MSHMTPNSSSKAPSEGGFNPQKYNSDKKLEQGYEELGALDGGQREGVKYLGPESNAGAAASKEPVRTLPERSGMRHC